MAHKSPDYLIIICALLLVIIGFLMLASASSYLGSRDFGDSYFYVRRQFFHFLIGVVFFIVSAKLPYRIYKGRVRSVLFLLFTFFLLGLVFTPLGFSAGGATRWLNLGGLTFQPAELLKLSLIIYLANWLSGDKRRRQKIGEGLIPFLVVMAVVAGLLFMQNSTSPVLILSAAALAMYFMSGAKVRYILSVILLGLISLTLLIAMSDYRAIRLTYFLNPEADPYGKGFQVLQAQNAIGSGGLKGVGFGNSLIKFSLPEPIGDSIFAVYAEEFGFLGTLLLVALFAFLVLRIFLLIKKVPDNFAKMLLTGFGSIFFIQFFFNLGAMSGFLPLTGTPLPFISYGGTALIIFMTMLGIIVNISKHA